jgi:hypothetical protein
MNLPTAEASNAVVIAKNPAKGQFMVDDIPLAVILTGDPLNNYRAPGASIAPRSKTCAWRQTRCEKSGANGAKTSMMASGKGGMRCPPSIA